MTLRRISATESPPNFSVAASASTSATMASATTAAAVVAEAMVALVLAEAATEKFGGDSIAEIRRNLAGYLDALVIR